MVNEVLVANLKISAVTRDQFLQEVRNNLNLNNSKIFVTTPNSEFLYASLRSSQVRDLLNRADIAIADGVGIFWAERFLSIPLRFQNPFLKTLQAIYQMVICGAKIILWSKSLYKVLPEKITGSNIIYDLIQLSRQEQKSVYLLGNWGDSAKKASEKFVELYPGLRIAGYSNKTYNDPTVIEDIKAVNPDLLFVGFGPIKQEQWIIEHLSELPVKLAMGVGGSFDYISGNKIVPPIWVREIGLEWSFRLVTQFRFRRVYQAVIGLIYETIKFKVSL